MIFLTHEKHSSMGFGGKYISLIPLLNFNKIRLYLMANEEIKFTAAHITPQYLQHDEYNSY